MYGKFGLILLQILSLVTCSEIKLNIEQEYPIICFQSDVKSLRELVYCLYAVIQLQTFIITSLVI